MENLGVRERAVPVRILITPAIASPSLEGSNVFCTSIEERISAGITSIDSLRFPPSWLLIICSPLILILVKLAGVPRNCTSLPSEVTPLSLRKASDTSKSGKRPI